MTKTKKSNYSKAGKRSFLRRKKAVARFMSLFQRECLYPREFAIRAVRVLEQDLK